MRRAVLACWLFTVVTAPWPTPPALARDSDAGAVTEPVRVTGEGPTLTVTLAPALQQALREHYPEFGLPAIREFDPEMVRLVRGSRKEPIVPFAFSADLDGDKRPDAALLIRNPLDNWLLVAFHQTRAGRFVPHRIERWNQIACSSPGKVLFLIERQPRGRLHHYIIVNHQLHDATMCLKNDGISMVWFRKAAEVYYLSKGKYRCVATAD